MLTYPQFFDGRLQSDRQMHRHIVADALVCPNGRDRFLYRFSEKPDFAPFPIVVVRPEGVRLSLVIDFTT
ncbi:MAG: hypothetical protein AAF609_22380 [Cyanobacteria bacterium P01_C01_bin.120]